MLRPEVLKQCLELAAHQQGEQLEEQLEKQPVSLVVEELERGQPVNLVSQLVRWETALAMKPGLEGQRRWTLVVLKQDWHSLSPMRSYSWGLPRC